MLKQFDPSVFLQNNHDTQGGQSVLAYHLSAPLAEAMPAVVYADYNISKLGELNRSKVITGELEDVKSKYSLIFFQVHSFDSLKQVYRDIDAATQVLSPQGELRIFIPPKTGEKRIHNKAASVFAEVKRLKVKNGDLIICHEPSPQTSSNDHTLMWFDDSQTGKTLELQSRPGLFSFNQVDTGSTLLLKCIPELSGHQVLDVGCGCGLLSVVIAARGATVTMVDVDARAGKLALENLHRNNLEGSLKLAPNLNDFADNQFDCVISNPPTHAGSAVLQELFAGMRRVTKPGGSVNLVVRTHLNYEKWLEPLGRLSRLAEEGGYKILCLSIP